MPDTIDETWEYWTPSEEWAEAFGGRGENTFDALPKTKCGQTGDRKAHGFRFGRGSPDFDLSRLAPPKWQRQDRHTLRRCRGCPRLFTPRDGSRKYCSIRCSADDRVVNLPKPCQNCGEMFQPYRSERIYCGGVCRAAASVRLKPRCCGQCGVTFRPLDSTRKYCGAACGWAAMVKLRPIPCGVCGREFLPRTSGRVNCSRVCGMRTVSRRRSGVPVNLDWDRIVELFAGGLGVSEIASALRTSRGGVRRALKARGVYRPGKPGTKRKTLDVGCRQCGKAFRPDNRRRVYCSAECDRSGRNRTPIDHGRAVEMHRQGVSVLEIARRLNCSDAGVRYAIKRATTTNTESGT